MLTWAFMECIAFWICVKWKAIMNVLQITLEIFWVRTLDDTIHLHGLHKVFFFFWCVAVLFFLAPIVLSAAAKYPWKIKSPSFNCNAKLDEKFHAETLISSRKIIFRYKLLFTVSQWVFFHCYRSPVPSASRSVCHTHSVCFIAFFHYYYHCQCP